MFPIVFAIASREKMGCLPRVMHQVAGWLLGALSIAWVISFWAADSCYQMTHSLQRNRSRTYR